MLQQGIARPFSSPWSSLVVLVQKKDGTTCFCIDYHCLNDARIKDATTLLWMDDSLDALLGGRWYSTLDLQSGYWQVPVHPSYQAKTAFSTSGGQPTVLPFGLYNAPATFARLMDAVLYCLTWETCQPYLDDIIIFGRTWEEHLLCLKEVLRRIRDINLKLKPSKCKLERHSVEFLGHVVSPACLVPAPSKLQANQDLAPLTDVKKARAFIGLASYYRRFIKNFV